MPEIRYQRLTRARGRGVFAVAVQSRASLWLGPDHLLCVDSSGYTETYKRFYFRDIQAITLQESKRRTVWNVVLALPLVCCFTGLMASLFPLSSSNGPAVVVWSIFSVVFLTPFAINNLLGTACVCHLRTAVQIEELPSLCRVRKARRILERIRPLITAAQGGELAAQAVAAQMRESVQSFPSGGNAAGQPLEG